MNEIGLREQLAALAHDDQWTGWMRYMFGLGVRNPDGSVTIPATHVARWIRQMNTRYADLAEYEKDSDRAEADKVLAILITAGYCE